MTIPTLTPYNLPSEWAVNKVQWPVDPARAVLLIHDMQDYFCDFWGEGSAFVVALVERLAAVRARCKALGIPVVYTAQPGQQADAERALLNDMVGAGHHQVSGASGHRRRPGTCGGRHRAGQMALQRLPALAAGTHAARAGPRSADHRWHLRSHRLP